MSHRASHRRQTIGETLTESEREIWDVLFASRNDPAVLVFRRSYEEDFRRLYPRWPEVLDAPYDDPEAAEFAGWARSLSELWLAGRTWDGGRAFNALSRPPRARQTVPAPKRECGCGPTDRHCLGCGWRLCEKCQPASGGAACRRCRGPVWADGEEKTPPGRNPAARGY